MTPSFRTRRSSVVKDRALARVGEHLIARVEERFSTVAADILQFEGKAAGDAKFGDRGGIEGKHHGFLDRCEEAHRLSDQGYRRILFAGQLLLRLGHREHHAIRLAFAEEAKALTHKPARTDVSLLAKFPHLNHTFLS